MIETIKKLLDSANLEDRKIAINLLESDNKILEEFVDKYCVKSFRKYTTYKYLCQDYLREDFELTYSAGKTYSYLVDRDVIYIDTHMARDTSIQANSSIKLEYL